MTALPLRLTASFLALSLFSLPVVAESALSDGREGNKGRSLYDGLAGDDLQRAEENLQLGLERRLSQSAESWRSPDGSATGFVLPVRSFKIESGHYCRAFFEAVAVGTVWRSASATACRTDEGRWLVVTP